MNLDTAKAIFARHTDKFITAYVFGSVAAGTADEQSDIDIILVRDTALPFFDRIREIMDLRLEFGAADLLIYTPPSWTRRSRRRAATSSNTPSEQDTELRERSREANRWLKHACRRERPPGDVSAPSHDESAGRPDRADRAEAEA